MQRNSLISDFCDYIKSHTTRASANLPAALPKPELKNETQFLDEEKRSFLFDLAINGDLTVRKRLAQDPNTPIEALWLLSESKEADLRNAVAANPGTPKLILSNMLKDKSRN